MTDPVASCIAHRLAKDIAFLAHQGVISSEDAQTMRSQLDSLVGTDFAQPFTTGPPVHQGSHPRAAYPPGVVSTPRAPRTTWEPGPPLGTNVYVDSSTSSTPSASYPLPGPPPKSEMEKQQDAQEDEEQEELATALYDYKPTAEDELPFVKGDTIVVVAHTTQDWFTGHVRGRLGSDRLFPANYVELRPTTTSTSKASKTPNNPTAGGTPSSSSYGSPPYPPATNASSAYYTPSGYAPQGYGAYPPPQQGYPPAQYETPASGSGPGGEDGPNAKKDKWGRFASSNVGQAAAGGAAFGVGMGIASSIF